MDEELPRSFTEVKMCSQNAFKAAARNKGNTMSHLKWNKPLQQWTGKQKVKLFPVALLERSKVKLLKTHHENGLYSQWEPECALAMNPSFKSWLETRRWIIWSPSHFLPICTPNLNIHSYSPPPGSLGFYKVGKSVLGCLSFPELTVMRLGIILQHCCHLSCD